MAGEKKTFSRDRPVVIIGGGIIGFSTAYCLSLARKTGRFITIVEKSSTLFTGASGKANGILGDYGFKPEAESLGKLSWELHQQLASQHGGRTAWGYRDVIILDLHHAASSDPSEVAFSLGNPPSSLPTWCRRYEKHARTLTSKHEHAARLDPAQFCEFLRKECVEMGVEILLDATVQSVGVENGSLERVAIERMGNRRTLECHSLVIAAGPWSETVLSGLFPNSRVRIPSSKQPSSGNYIVIKVPKWDSRKDTGVCHQVYLEGPFGHKVDISSRPDGTFYVGGDLPAQEELPGSTGDVQPQVEYVRQMETLQTVLSLSSDEVEIMDTGRADRPCLDHGRPVVAHIPLDDLLGITYRGSTEGREVEQGGVYLNVGHGRDGITLAPGSGQVMSELIGGIRPMSADVSSLGSL